MSSVVGVSTGLAALCGCSPWLIRMGWVLAGLISLKFTLLAYLVLALVMPARKSAADTRARQEPSAEVSKVEALEQEFRELEKRMGG